MWASREIHAYSKAFGLPQNKFTFVPYHTTLDKHSLNISEGEYLFSGGNYQRDYGTLIAAVKGLPVTLKIGCTRDELFQSIEVPENVSIKGYSEREYLVQMAGCRISIVPLDVNHLHSGGQQTILNSMWLGKPTIVTDPEGAGDYIDDGVDGILVTPGKPNELRKAIEGLARDPQKARSIGARARNRVLDTYSTEAHFQKIVSLAYELVAEQRA